MSTFQYQKERLYTLLTKNNTCFLRNYHQESALWITDFPQRCNDQDALNAFNLLTDAGFVVTLCENRLWLVDLQPKVYQSIFMVSDEKPAYLYPEKPAALISLLLAHPSDFEKEPIEDLRLLFKASVKTDEMDKACDSLLLRSAYRLRTGGSVAYHGAFFLMRWLESMG